MEAVGEEELSAVGEDVRAATGDDASEDEVGEVAVPGDLAEADDDADAREGDDLGGEVDGAVADLLGEGLVAGWGAADDGGDPGVAEAEAVGAGDGEGGGGEAEGVEDGVHEVAGAVSGEGAAGAVGTVGSGGEAEDEDAGVGVAEPGDGTGPIGLVEVGAAADFTDGLAVEAETGTALAGDDVLADDFKGGCPGEGQDGI